jgi:hypothetical protein
LPVIATPSAVRQAAWAVALMVGVSMISPAVAQQASDSADSRDQNPDTSPLRGTAGAANAAAPLPQDDSAPYPRPRLTSPTNYGKPKPRPDPRLNYPGRRKTPAHPLPPLEPYPTSVAAKLRLKTLTPDKDFPPPPSGMAIVPQIPRKQKPKVEENPYAPVGIGVGSLRLTPYVETDTGYDSNPNRIQTPGHGSKYVRGEAGFDLKSDWSTNQLTGSFKAGYSDYTSYPTASRPDGQGKFDLRIDVTRDSSLDFETRGSLDTQQPGSPELTTTTVKNRPIVASFGGTAGGTQHFGDLELGLHGTIDRTINENATLTDGTVIPLSTGNYNAYGTQLRAGYQIKPGVTPFVEISGDVRRHDESIDAGGYARNSTGFTGKVGTTFELSQLLTGQVSAGYSTRSYVDARLPSLSAPTFDASLIWTATPLTTVTLTAATNLNETTVAGASGAVSRTVSLAVSHALLRNLTLGAVGAIGFNDYNGVDVRETSYSATLKADYNLTRSIVVRGSFTHERLKSTAVGSDYTANVFLLGLKLQR